jgi:SAM-dependent methyltransferase
VRIGLSQSARLNLLAAAAVAAAIVLSWAVARPPEPEIDKLVQVLALNRASSLADVGAGSGEVSIAIARRVPEGIVYSTEINPQLLAKIRANSRRAGMRNIIPVRGKDHDTELPTNCCDAIFLREVYHHLTDPSGMDRSLYLAMRPGGRLAIIDFEPIPGTRPPSGVPANRGGHGVPARLVSQELSRAGFRLVEGIDWPISRVTKPYCMLFRKPLPTTAPNAAPGH